MRKKLIFLFILIFLVACASEGTEDAGGEQTNDTTDETEALTLSSEILFSYDHEDAGDYYLMSIQTDTDGKGIVFTEVEEIDRVTDYYTYFVNHNDEVIEGISLADDPDQERRCTNMFLSPNGQYLVYDCHDDGIEFSIYDLEQEEIIHQIPDFEIYVQDIVGISNDLTVYLQTTNDDGDEQFTLYDVDTETSEHYIFDDIFDLEYPSFNAITPTNDGQKVFFDAITALFILNLDTGVVDEIANVEPLWETFDDDLIFIYNSMISPDGKYAYYNISDNSSDTDYSEYVFHNLETGEIDSYAEFDYQTVRNFDLHGNLLIAADDQLYLYNFETKETRVVPDIALDRHSGYMTLAHNGQFIFYTGKVKNDDDTYTQHLYRVTLGDTDTFETTSLPVKASVEREPIEPIEDDQISLHDASLNEVEILNSLWEDSTQVMYPTKFPEDLSYINNSFSGEPSDRDFTQFIYFDTGKVSSNRNDLNFSASIVENDDKCIALSDLEVVKTIDGVDYYFYDYRNADVEAGVRIDNVCYIIKAEDYTEEEMLSMIESLEPIDTVFYDLPSDQFKFPTKFPIANPEARYPTLRSNQNGDSFSYSISYYGDEESDIKMVVDRRNNEPKLYMSEKHGFAVDVAGWDEAYFSEFSMELILFDGTDYYSIDLAISDDMVEALGIDELSKLYTEIGASFK